jgi:hypothetical protein
MRELRLALEPLEHDPESMIQKSGYRFSEKIMRQRRSALRPAQKSRS